MSKKELDKIIQEVKGRMNYNPPKKTNKGLLIGIGIAVIASLIGLVLWLRAKSEEDIEEYYEYFDDELDEDELDEDELYGIESILDDEDELEDEDDTEIGYVKIKNFIDEDEELEEEPSL